MCEGDYRGCGQGLQVCGERVSCEALVRGLSKGCGCVDGGPSSRASRVWIEAGCIEGVVREASVPGCVTGREFQCRTEGVVRECSGGCGQV